MTHFSFIPYNYGNYKTKMNSAVAKSDIAENS